VTSLLERLARVPALPLVLGLLTALLSLSALGHGWYGDDWFHRSLLMKRGMFAALPPDTPHAVWVLFRFLGPGGATDFLVDSGLFPWWGDPEVAAGFLRPVSALTHVLDTELWPESAALQHAHSLLWAVLGVATMTLALRRMLGGALPASTVALAMLLYAVEDAHSTPVAWIANRNALVALVTGGLTLLAHLRWAEEGRRAWAPVAVGLSVVALLTAEAGLGGLAWILAWQLTCARGSWGRRLAQVLPYAVVVLVWRGVYDHLGYGAENSGLYVDPGAGLLTFLGALADRWPVLVASLWAPLPVDTWALAPTSAHGLIALAALGVVVLMGVIAWPLLVRRDPVGDRARLLALGALGCLIPPSAAFPMDRVVGFAAVGSAALVAVVWAHGPQAGPRRLASWGLLLLHGPVAAVLLVGRVASLPLMGELFGAGALGAPKDAALADQVLLFANGTDFAAIYTPVRRALSAEGPVPLRTTLLASSITSHTVHREDEHTLVYTAEDGFLGRGLDQLLRSPARPIPQGSVIERPDFTATVRTSTPDGRPETVAFRFVRPVDDPLHRWVVFRGLDPRDRPHLVPWSPPGLGETVVLEAAAPIR
jgi:hypothetical protein